MSPSDKKRQLLKRKEGWFKRLCALERCQPEASLTERVAIEMNIERCKEEIASLDELLAQLEQESAAGNESASEDEPDGTPGAPEPPGCPREVGPLVFRARKITGPFTTDIHLKYMGTPADSRSRLYLVALVIKIQYLGNWLFWKLGGATVCEERPNWTTWDPDENKTLNVPTRGSIDQVHLAGQAHLGGDFLDFQIMLEFSPETGDAQGRQVFAAATLVS
jgi:hypothetical protein